MSEFVSERAKRKTALQALALVVVMGALAWASVPFYDWFCRVTGFGGITNVADALKDGGLLVVVVLF